MKPSKARDWLAIGFTIFNLLFFIPFLGAAYVLPMGLACFSYQRVALFFVIFTWLSPLSVPIGIYKGWKSIGHPSIKLFLFYHLLPAICFCVVMLFSIIVCYWPW
jgi:hypothetical protein